MTRQLTIVNDEILLGEYLVGLVVQQGTPATILKEFAYRVQNNDGKDYSKGIDDLVSALDINNRGGLIRISDLTQAARNLKEKESES